MSKLHTRWGDESLMRKKLGFVIRLFVFFLICAFLVFIIPANDAIPLNGFKRTSGESVKLAVASGNALDEPPCSLAYYSKAVSLGFMVLSADVYMTSDSVLVIADTDDISKSTEAGSGSISTSTYDELSKLNFAYYYMDADGAYPYRSKPLTLLRLSELFESFTYSDFIIKLKVQNQHLEDAVLVLSELARKNGLSARIVLEASSEVNDVLRKNKDIISVTYLRTASVAELNRYNFVRKLLLSNFYISFRFQHIELPINMASQYPKSLFDSLKKRNISFFISEVNSGQELEAALSLEPDGIVTNQPEAIAAILYPLSEETESPESSEVE